MFFEASDAIGVVVGGAGFLHGCKTAPVAPDMSVEVDDVDAAYAVMRDSGAEIVPARTQSCVTYCGTPGIIDTTGCERLRAWI
ncbi:hypothetical protein [Streptomyces sp. NPDC003006]